MAGNLSIEQCGNVFANPKRQASSNYGIDSQGRVGLYVDEANRSWCSSSATYDRKSITIEVANNSGAPYWTVSKKAMDKLIELCADICKRNNIKKLNYTGDLNGNLIMHCWLTSTLCPGPYLKSKFDYIAEEVNKRIGAQFKPYLIKVTVDALNIRKGPSVDYEIVTTIKDKGIYTIVSQNGEWGLLKAYQNGRNGWINLYYTKEIKK